MKFMCIKIGNISGGTDLPSVGTYNPVYQEKYYRSFDENFEPKKEPSPPPPPPAPPQSQPQPPPVTSVMPVNGKANSNAKSKANGKAKAEVTERRAGVPAQPINAEQKLFDIQIVKHEKDSDSERLIKEAFRKNEFLKHVLDDDRLQAVVDAMYPKRLNPKEYIIREGEQGSHLYVSASGFFEVLKGNTVVNKIKSGEVFGELAILYNAKRQASVKVVERAKIWVLDRSVYQKIMLRSAVEHQEELNGFLMNVPVLNEAPVSVLNKVAGILKKEFFSTGKVIVKQGDKGDKFYIITVGSVVVTKTVNGGREEINVGTLTRGSFFGERALLYEDTRQATVTAQAPGVECLSLTREDFLTYFGDGNFRKEHTRVSEGIEISRKEQYDHIQFDDLDIIETLGVGGFGRVELVQWRLNKDQTFAIKYLKKTDMVQQQQQEHAYNEKHIMMKCDSMFICKLYKTFKDRKYLYFLMEACLGGDVWTLLQKQKNRCFDEKTSRFMTACVIEAFEYLHARDIIYRDLKPENLLLDMDGYVKLVDFGFAKILGSRGKTYTFAGTPEYVAPEIILNRGHDKAVDYWALGVFIHELLVGKPPFRGQDHMKTYNLILKGIEFVQFSPKINKTVQLLIRKLCRNVPMDRLGMQKDGIGDIKKYKWFLGFDWQQLQKKQIKAPLIPTVRSCVDTRNFERYPKDIDIPPDEESGWDKDF